jgi:catechol 2,3-dioxygenase-like lactoylglutathione lyase family enzyme
MSERPAGNDAIDRGATHVALPVTDIDRSIEFYARYADMRVVHRRTDAASGTSVAWISDLTRPFVIVIIEAPRVEGGLSGLWSHLGVGVASRADVDRRCEQARSEGRTVLGPTDSGYPVGYWAYIVDPDGHNLEVSYGQEVGLVVEQTRTREPEPS